MRLLTQSTAVNILVFMTDSTDHIAGKTGLTLTITASKAAAAFASITPTVTERTNGWYQLALTTSHTDTLGDFALHVTATGADTVDVLMQVGVDLAFANAVVAKFADDSGTAQGGAAGTITLRSGAVATDSYYNGAIVHIVSGTGAGQSRKISSYVGSTRVATVDSNWTTNPDNTSVYIILGRVTT